MSELEIRHRMPESMFMKENVALPQMVRHTVL